ncbi:MAG: transposon-encoded TnpW family protein [Oscillospiraceae bacterium]|nr:transposon-encoded TnpW family protein [Oscillospiraceae bacterium]
MSVINSSVDKNYFAENIHEIKIGRVSYKVISYFKESAKDTAVKKIERLIKRDLKAS